MENLSLTVKERILLVAGYAKLSKTEFFKDLGMSYASFKGDQKKTGLSSDALLRVLSKYPEINPSWLLLGEGEMVRSESRNEAIISGMESVNATELIGAGKSFLDTQLELIDEFKKLSSLVVEQAIHVIELGKRVDSLEGKKKKKNKDRTKNKKQK